MKSTMKSVPVLFKLSERYVRTASSHGFEFHQGNPSHRLALFLLKFDKEKKRFEPDWETLCLSDYIHQEKSPYTLLSSKFQFF